MQAEHHSAMPHGARPSAAAASHSLMARTQRQLQTLTRRHPRRCAGVLLLSLVLLGTLLSLSSSSSSPAASPRAPLTVTSLAARAGSMLARLPAALLRAAEDPDARRQEQHAAAAAAAHELILESEERDAGPPAAMRNHTTTTADNDAADLLVTRPRGELEAGYKLLPVYPAMRKPVPASTLVEEEGGADTKEKDSKADTAKPDSDKSQDSKNGDEVVSKPPSKPASPVAAHWTYASPRTGPFMWGNLDPKYVSCNAGHRQSPVDFKVVDPVRHPSLASLPSAVRTDPSLQHILFNYAPANVTLLHHDNVTHIDTLLNNGHTLQVTYESGSGIYVRGRRFDLAQFHFHSPSEHTLNGRHFDMEMHLVHAAQDGSGRLVVVALWLEVPRGVVAAIHDLRGQYSSLDDLHDGNTFGEVKRLLHVGASPFLESLGWTKLPQSPGAAAHASTPVLNVFDALPFDQGYLTYEGSLTTPPCSEVVSWYVLKAPIAVSLAQKNAFVALFGQNARPTQLLHGRNVTQTVDQERGRWASGIINDHWQQHRGPSEASQGTALRNWCILISAHRSTPMLSVH